VGAMLPYWFAALTMGAVAAAAGSVVIEVRDIYMCVYVVLFAVFYYGV